MKNMGFPKKQKNDGETPIVFKSNFGTLLFIPSYLQKKTLFWNDNAEQLLSKQENTGLSMHTHVWTLVHTQEAYAQYAHYTLCA